jgi:hypothetical protein
MVSVGKYLVTIFPERVVDFLATCLSFVTNASRPERNSLAVNSKMSGAVDSNERRRHTGTSCALEAELTVFVSQ